MLMMKKVTMVKVKKVMMMKMKKRTMVMMMMIEDKNFIKFQSYCHCCIIFISLFMFLIILQNWQDVY